MKTMRESRVTVTITVADCDDEGVELERMNLVYLADLRIPMGANATRGGEVWIKIGTELWALLGNLQGQGPYR